MGFRSTSLVRQDKASSDPHSRSTEHKSSSNRLAVEQTTGSNNLHGLAGEGALFALHQLGNGRDQHSGRDVTGVTTTLTTLGADNVDIKVKAFLNVLGVSDHIHVEHAVLVELLHDSTGRNTDSADEEPGAAFNDDINKLVEFSVGVIMAEKKRNRLVSGWQLCFETVRESNILGLSRVSANLRQKQVNTERRVLIVQKALEFGNLVLEHLRGVTNATNNTETTSVRDSGSQLGASSHVHSSEQNGVVDLQEIRDRRAELFWIMICVSYSLVGL